MAKTPKIVNVADLSKKNLDFKLLHFSKAQWKKATADVDFSGNVALPKSGAIVRGLIHPDGGVSASFDCIGGPGQNCIGIKKGIESGRGFGLEISACKCTGGADLPGTGGGGPIVQPQPKCSLRIANGRIGCVNNSCQGTCRLRGIIQPNGTITLFCACV